MPDEPHYEPNLLTDDFYRLAKERDLTAALDCVRARFEEGPTAERYANVRELVNENRFVALYTLSTPANPAHVPAEHLLRAANARTLVRFSATCLARQFAGEAAEAYRMALALLLPIAQGLKKSFAEDALVEALLGLPNALQCAGDLHAALAAAQAVLELVNHTKRNHMPGLLGQAREQELACHIGFLHERIGNFPEAKRAYRQVLTDMAFASEAGDTPKAEQPSHTLRIFALWRMGSLYIDHPFSNERDHSEDAAEGYLLAVVREAAETMSAADFGAYFSQLLGCSFEEDFKPGPQLVLGSPDLAFMRADAANSLLLLYAREEEDSARFNQLFHLLIRQLEDIEVIEGPFETDPQRPYFLRPSGDRYWMDVQVELLSRLNSTQSLSFLSSVFSA